MNADLANAVFATFVVFCRIGAAMMLVPGFGSARVPVMVRMMLALAFSMALMPLLYPQVSKLLAPFAEAERVYLLVNEVAVGLAMGLMARMFLIALQFAATTIANSIGLAGVPGQPAEETEALPPLTNLLSLGAVMIVVAAGVPETMLRTVAQSYDALPLRIGIDTEWFVENIFKVLADTTLLALRLAAPFIVYAIVVNVAMGLANKFTPQVQMYFASLGVVTMGGLVLLYLSSRELFEVFLDAFTGWVAGG